MKQFALLHLAIIAAPALAVQITCHTNKATAAETCFAESEVREKDGIRSTPLYTGGPNNVRKTSMTMAVNCETKVVHLKDRDGVSFAGGQTGTPAMRALREWICETKLKQPATKKKT